MRSENIWDEFEDFWESFGIRIGPFGVGVYSPRRYVRYSRTDTSHVLRIRIDPTIRKEEVKARLVEPGLIEIEWPRQKKGEDIPVE